jgi:type II secretory ATPase GspE/PulE/Tfp pilus assembly ATPase PilB-like protein
VGVFLFPYKNYINQNSDFSASSHETVKNSQDQEIVMDDEIVKFVNKVLEEAVQRKASDIHFEVYEKEMVIKYRLDGVLYAYQKVDKSKQNKIISRIKIMAGLNISQTRIPQDGRFSMQIEHYEINFRVSILPSIFGETAVIRILSGYQFNYSLEKLGMSTKEISILQKALSSAGMVLVSGPTGSGKTTTLYSAIGEIRDKGYKIITIEDPVEYDIEGVVQIAVNEKVGMSFSEGLRSIVRQDPDVIMVGEIRDKETANIAVNAALTGHLVLSTVHANSPFDTLMRLQRLEIPPYQLVSALSVIIFQRLVRKLCEKCKQPFSPDQYFKQKYKDFLGKDSELANAYKGVGCDKCYFTGYEGRIGLFEMVDFSELRMDLLSMENYRDWKSVLEEKRIRSLKNSAEELIKNGITTLDEVERSLI